MSTFLNDPVTGFGVGLMLASTMTLLVFVWMRRENNTWQRRHGELAAENRRLRVRNATLEGHPSTRNSMDEHWSAFVEHTDQALRLAAAAPLADVVDLRGGPRG